MSKIREWWPVIHVIACFMTFGVLFMTSGCQEKRQLIYKSGDIVRLKSGGPDMTVEHDVYSDNSVRVEWHDYMGQPQSRSYYQSQIESVK